jgi:Carboxypeptidase regulatory-like domain
VKRRLYFGVVLALSCLSAVAFAQNYRGTIRGRINAPTGQVAAGVQVKLIHEETNSDRTATTNSNGEYAFSLLPPGAYRLEVEQASVNNRYVHKVNLQVNQDVRVDISFTSTPHRETIEVVEPLTPLKRDSASLGAVIDNAQVTGLPLDGRNFLELSLLVPGATPAAQGSAGSVRGDFTFNINGTREDSNNYLLDGVYNVDPKLNTFGVKPPVDAIREFEVLASVYDASFGRSAGAQVNIVLKSGTNRFHGSVYEFLRNQVFDARNFFAPAGEPDPKYQRNQFGFSLGGPVITDRTFFFGDYEGTRLREGITLVTNVPTAQERIGDFSNSLLGKPFIPGTQFQFPGGKIPAEFLNPIGLKIAALYPLPNRNVPFQNFVSSPVLRDRQDIFDVRIDHDFSDASKFAARYSFTDRDLFEPFSGVTLVRVPGYGNTVNRRGQNVLLSETHIFSPVFVNDARFAYNRVANNVRHENYGRSVNQSVGLPELSANPRDFGLSFITATGYSPLGDEYNNPQFSATNVYQFLDTATYSLSKHLIKFGLDFRVAQQNAFRDVQARGFLTFSSLVPLTQNALADLLIALPALTGGAKLDNYQHLRTRSYNFFINDSYRIRPNLTVTAGLRYEYNSPPVDTDDRANIYDIATRSLVQVGTEGVPRSGYAADKNNLAPRIGLAWGITGNTVLRTGYGIYYDQSPLAPGEGLYFNSPYFILNFYFSLPGLPLTLFNPFPQNFPVPSPPAAFTFDRHLRTAYVQHWNFGIERQLGRNIIAEIAYVGSKGAKLLLSRDINQPLPSGQMPNLRPNPFFGEILIQESSASSIYHSLQGRIQKRLDFGLSLLGSYTWAKSIDDASGIFSSTGDPNFPQDSYNLRAERGRSNFDVKHRFSLSYAYDLPFGKGKSVLSNAGWVTALVSGWQTYGVITLQSGRPFTVALLQEFDNSNTGRSNLGFGANDRPNLVGVAKLDNPTPERWFNTAAFVIPPFGNFGNAGRNILDGPGLQNVNFSVMKNTVITERANLQLRAEFFNLFNHPNFGLPDNFVGSPSFGSILSAQSPRRIQFGMKLLF